MFDTCALLDFYYMTIDYQEIIAEILRYLNYRIWIPAHVVYEYAKNREHAMRKPKTEKYNDKGVLKNNFVNELKACITQWERQYYHPYLDFAKLQSIKDALVIIEPKIAFIKTTIAMEYQARKNEIDDICKNDIINDVVQALPKGTPFTYSEIKEIVREGKSRYANQIPPGFKDAETKNGIHQYGDLIIWKEILNYAKNKGQDVIFVTNETKADWIMVDETSKDDKAEKPMHEELGHPRRELLVEFEEDTGHQIWFYKTTDFISKLEEIYQPSQAELPFYGKLGSVRDVLNRAEHERYIRSHHHGDSMLIRCGTCGELFEVESFNLNFEWEGCISDDDRGMGCEYQYDSQESCECPNCGHQIDLTLQVWEYPVGAFNTQNIEIDGGNIEETIDLSDYISFDNYELCEHCGERTVLNNMGLCEQCEHEFRDLINSDD